MASFQLLDQREEDDLHKTRLLNVEEKPFKRITKRLLAPGSLISIPTTFPPTPPPDGATDDAVDAEATQQKQLEERRQFREEVLLDFAAFDSSIARIQFLRNSNERERERYAAEKIRILEAAQAVKDNTSQLRIQLEEAKATLNQRKKFDELAEKITNNRMLKTREEQAIHLLKLEDECKELEKESKTYSETWKERREQFGRIVEEGLKLRQLIRDEKEEVERREGMNDGGEEDGEPGEVGSRGGATPKHSSMSGGATPKPDGAGSPRRDRSASPGASPRRGESPARLGRHGRSDREKHKGLKPKPQSSSGRHSRASSRAGSHARSRTSSPTIHERRKEQSEREDSVMDDIAIDTPMAEAVDSPAEEGEVEIPQVTIREPGADDKMDTT